LFILSKKGEKENNDEDWLEEDKPKRDTFLLRVIAAMATVAVFLIMMGIPTDNPIVFLYAVVFLTGGALFVAIINAELSKELFGKRK